MTTATKNKVAKMLANQGVYICGDTKFPAATVVIVSKSDGLWSTKLDRLLSANRWLDTMTIKSGPHK